MRQRPEQREKILKRVSNIANSQKVLLKKQLNTGDITNDEKWYEKKWHEENSYEKKI